MVVIWIQSLLCKHIKYVPAFIFYPKAELLSHRLFTPVQTVIETYFFRLTVTLIMVTEMPCGHLQNKSCYMCLCDEVCLL